MRFFFGQPTTKVEEANDLVVDEMTTTCKESKVARMEKMSFNTIHTNIQMNLRAGGGRREREKAHESVTKSINSIDFFCFSFLPLVRFPLTYLFL